MAMETTVSLGPPRISCSSPAVSSCIPRNLLSSRGLPQHAVARYAAAAPRRPHTEAFQHSVPTGLVAFGVCSATACGQRRARRAGTLFVQRAFVRVQRGAKSSKIAGPSVVKGKNMDGASIGIDFGTTNSAVAVQRPDGSFLVIPAPGMPNGNPTLPSVVAYNSAGQSLVGADAARIKPDGYRQVVFRSVKRLLGRTYEEAAKAGIDPNELGADPRGRANELIRLLLPGNLGTISPEDVAAEIIRTLVQVAEAYLGTRVIRAVIGVPARFDANQTRAIEHAAELGGLKAIRLVREPELAVRAYGLRINPAACVSDGTLVLSGIASGRYGRGDVDDGDVDDGDMDMERDDMDPDERGPELPNLRHILVADLGGGTFDVCIVREIVDWDEIHMLFTAGEERLGGDDFDMAIMKWAAAVLRPHLERPEVRLWPLSPDNKRKLLLIARRAKERLSSAESTRLEFAGAKVTITREDFNVIASHTLQRMLTPLREASYGAKVRLPFETLASQTYFAGDRQRKRNKRTNFKPPTDANKESLDHLQKKLGAPASDAEDDEPLIDEVLCIGAASWTPAVRELFELITGCKPTVSFVEPETAVALGAAVLASVTDAKIPDMQVHSQWRAAWTEYVLKRPDLIDKLKDGKDPSDSSNEEEGDPDDMPRKRRVMRQFS